MESLNKSTIRLDPTIRKIVSCSVVLTVALAVVYLARPAFVEYLDYRVTDTISAGAPGTVVSDAVLVVDIDEKTLAACGQWPWPRYRLKNLLTAIARMKARSIALDFILAESDRTSVKAIREALRGEFGYELDSRPVPTELLDNDAMLADALSKGPFVLGFEFRFDDASTADESCHPYPLNVARIQAPGVVDGSKMFYQARGIVCNLRQFTDAAPSSGFLNGQPDSDGRLRRLPLLIRYGDALYPSLPLAALMSASPDRTLNLRQGARGQQDLLLGNTAIPMDAQGNVRINFASGRHNPRHVAAESVLKGQASPADFRDRIVFVGLSASGLASSYLTPMTNLLSAVEIHAQLTETIVTGNFIRRPWGVVYGEVLLAIFLVALFSLCIARLELAATAVIGAAGIVALWVMAHLLFKSHGLIFSPMLPTGAIMINGLLLVIFKYWTRQRAARRSMNDALILMKSSERLLGSIIQTIPDIVFRLDASGRITFISPAMAKYRKHPDELIGTPILDLVVPEDRKTATYRINERRTGNRATANLELRLLLPPPEGDRSDAKRYFSVSAEGIYAEEKPATRFFIGTQGIARDIDQRKQLESQLEQSKKMEAIGSLASGIAHDLNNILSGVVSYPELLLLDLPANSPMRRSLEAIRSSGEQAAAIIQDMLTIARRGAKSSEIFNLNQTIASYLDTPEFQNMQRSNPHIHVRTDLSDDLMNMKGSSLHLLRLIMNLISNAVEAMPAGGAISLATRNCYLDKGIRAYEPIPEGEYVLLGVGDEGIGIAPDDLPRVFEPFYSKKKMRRSGSGLGMTVVWSTVKDHSGYVDVQSREGVGTRFEFYLPVTREERNKTECQIVLQDYIGTESILVVDDVPEQLEIAMQMLSKLGYHVASASSGEEAVAYIKTHAVDLLVLDMVMHPGIDGLETYRRIVQEHPGQKAIIASGYAESEFVKAVQLLGAGAYIHKPYKLEKIGLAVRCELDRR